MNCKGCEVEIDRERYEEVGLCLLCELQCEEILINLSKGDES